METVERNGHEHRPNTVDRRKRSIQKTRAVLVDARFNNGHVIDDLDNQTEYATHHENPEQIEEVQLDIAFARLVAAEGSVFGTLARLKVGQLALKAALFRKRGVDIRQQGDEEHQMQHFIEARAMQARKHDLAHHNGDVDRYENFGRNTRTATAIAKHAHAQNNGHNRANARKSDLDYGDNERRRVDRRSGITSKRRQVEAQNRRNRNRDYRERDKRNCIYLKQQREFLFWRRRKRIRCGHIPWALPSLLSMHNNAPIITMYSAIKARKQPFFAQKPSCPGEERVAEMYRIA